MLLIDFVRAHGCKSCKRGCETSNCGLCTVFLDEKPVLSLSLIHIYSGHYRQCRRAGGKAAGGQGSGQGRGTCPMRLACGRRKQPAKSGGIPAVQSGGGSGRRSRGLQMHVLSLIHILLSACIGRKCLRDAGPVFPAAAPAAAHQHRPCLLYTSMATVFREFTTPIARCTVHSSTARAAVWRKPSACVRTGW